MKCQNYFVCSNCKMCKAGHNLFKCYSLKNKGMGGYKQNNFNCDVCKKSKYIVPGTEDDYVWHCNPCQFDACKCHFAVDNLKSVVDSIQGKSSKPKVPQQNKEQKISGGENLNQPDHAAYDANWNDYTDNGAMIADAYEGGLFD